MVATAGYYEFSEVHGIVRHHVFQHQFSCGGAFDDSLQPRFVEDDSQSAGSIVDHEHLGSGTECEQDFAHHSIGGNHRHVLLDAIGRTFIDIN